MKFTLDGIEVECTVQEFFEYQELKKSADARANSAIKKEPVRHQNKYDYDEDDRQRADTRSDEETSNNSIVIDENLFFHGVSPLMAEVMLAHYKYGGELSQSQLNEETGKSGPALRRPNGALNDRVRVATGGKLKRFSVVVESNLSNNAPDRVYRTDENVLRFLGRNLTRIRKLLEN
jgi:hypothetical protein